MSIWTLLLIIAGTGFVATIIISAAERSQAMKMRPFGTDTPNTTLVGREALERRSEELRFIRDAEASIIARDGVITPETVAAEIVKLGMRSAT